MTETPFTGHCRQNHDLVRRMHTFAAEKVLPAITQLQQDATRPKRKLDETVCGAYARMVAWMGSLVKLGGTGDVQAICAGARCLFELLLDLKWLAVNQEPVWLEKFDSFPRVHRYHSAEKAAEYKNKNPGSQICERDFRAIMDKLDQPEPVGDLVARLWGKDSRTGKPRWPRHWTGENNTLDVAGKLGTEFTDLHRQCYSPLSWVVHSGPAAFHGRDFAGVEQLVATGYLSASEFLFAGTGTACTALGIAGTIPDFEPGMNDLSSRLDEAQRTMPPMTEK